MGSVILASSSIKRARVLYPEAEIFFWIFQRNRECLDLLGLVATENVLTIRDTSVVSFLWDIGLGLQQVWRMKVDVVIDLELFSRFTAILCGLSRPGVGVGFYAPGFSGIYRGHLHTHRVIYNVHYHISYNFLALVESSREQRDCTDFLLKRNLDHLSPGLDQLPGLAADVLRMQAFLLSELKVPSFTNKLVILNPGINDALPLRCWPLDYYVQLAERLLQVPSVVIVLIGTSEQKKSGHAFKVLKESGRCIDLIGRTSVRDLAGLCAQATVMVSHDSGAVHIASLTGVPVLAMFGPETPDLYGPLSKNAVIISKQMACSPCLSAYNHRFSACRDNRCLKEITVNEVYEKVCPYVS